MGSQLWPRAVIVGGGGGDRIVRHDNDGTYDYSAHAPAGTANDATVWNITRITLTMPHVTGTATGAWTARAGLVYV